MCLGIAISIHKDDTLVNSLIIVLPDLLDG